MNLTLERVQFSDSFTIGRLFVDGEPRCWVCEDAVREVPGRPVSEWKVYGQTAIPYGTYKIAITMSQRFGRPLPLLLDVPGFSGVRIHPGNTAKDTEGCLLPGLDRLTNGVGRSRIAFDQLFADMEQQHDMRIVIVRGEGRP